MLSAPLKNPDGRARFIFQNKAGRAAEPDGDRLAAERDEPWPGGRTNHYLFDMNRDWIARSQPETRGRDLDALHDAYSIETPILAMCGVPDAKAALACLLEPI